MGFQWLTPKVNAGFSGKILATLQLCISNRKETPGKANRHIKAFIVMDCAEDIKYASAPASLRFCSTNTHSHKGL